MDYKIVDVDLAQLEQIEAMEKECFSMPWTCEQLKSQLRDDRHEFITALDSEGTVLGYVGMMYVEDEGYIKCGCKPCQQAPGHRGRACVGAYKKMPRPGPGIHHP